MPNCRINYKKVQELVHEGLKDREIADRVGCQPQSISTYRCGVMKVFKKARADWVKGDALIKQGISDKAISEILGVVEYTVRNRRQAMVRKALGAELVKQTVKFTGTRFDYKAWLPGFMKTRGGMAIREYNNDTLPPEIRCLYDR